MSTRIRFTTAIMIATLAFSCLQGCRHNGGDPGPDPNQFYFYFTGLDFSYGHYWIVLNTADGDSILAVKRITSNDMVAIGSPVADRATVTIIQGSPSHDFYVTTFVNVHPREWLYGSRNEEASPVGYAEVTIDFPPRHYDNYRMIWPSGANGETITALPDTTRQIRDTLAVKHLAANHRLYTWAMLTAGDSNWCGWMDNQPFTLNQTNRYSFSVDRPVPVRNITTNHPLGMLSLNISMRPQMGMAYVSRDWPDNLSTSFMLMVPSFPQVKIWLTGSGSEDGRSYGVWQELDSVPSMWNMPSGDLTAEVNPTTGAFENIQLSGTADAIWGGWNSYHQGSTMWLVFADPTVTTMARPTLPDSLLALLPVDSAGLQPMAYGLRDYDPIAGLESYISLNFGENPTGQQQYTSGYESYRSVSGSTTGLNPAQIFTLDRSLRLR